MARLAIFMALLLPLWCSAEQGCSDADKPCGNGTALTSTLRGGKSVFADHCVQCHGPNGAGDGKLAAVIRDPAPFNLTLSHASDDYLRQIVRKGGAAMGRSARMPVWGKELDDLEIESVVQYVKTLRRVSSNSTMR
jgi:mono/diheme cytochrome c family protein